MNRGVWVLIVGATALTAAVALYLRRSPVEPGPVVKKSEPAPARAPRHIAAPGRVEPVSEEIRMGSEINGKLRQVLVDEGDRVKQGQVVAVLENADWQARVAGSEADVAHREAVIHKLENGSRVEERREAAAAVAEARAVLENAKADVARRRELFRSGDIAKADLDRYERELGVAQARFDATTQRRDVVESSTRAEDLDVARAELQRARAELAAARALLAKTFLRAPIAGLVLRRHHRSGESVSDQFDDPVLTFGDDSTLRVRVDVDEADVAQVKVGQPVYVMAEAYGQQRFTGKVVRIGQLMGRKNIRTDEPKERVDKKILETLVELDAGQRLPAGLRVDAYLQLP